MVVEGKKSHNLPFASKGKLVVYFSLSPKSLTTRSSDV